MRKSDLDLIEEYLDFWLKISSFCAFLALLAAGVMFIIIPLVFDIPA